MLNGQRPYYPKSRQYCSKWKYNVPLSSDSGTGVEFSPVSTIGPKLSCSLEEEFLEGLRRALLVSFVAEEVSAFPNAYPHALSGRNLFLAVCGWDAPVYVLCAPSPPAFSGHGQYVSAAISSTCCRHSPVTGIFHAEHKRAPDDMLGFRPNSFSEVLAIAASSLIFSSPVRFVSRSTPLSPVRNHELLCIMDDGRKSQ